MFTTTLGLAWLAALVIFILAFPRLVWALVIFAIAALLLGACGTTTPIPEEIEWDREMDRVNWELCERAYRHAGVPTRHRDHTHTRAGVRGMDETWALKQDLADNLCRSILGDWWAE